MVEIVVVVPCSADTDAKDPKIETLILCLLHVSATEELALVA